MSTLYYLNQYVSKTLNTTGGINSTQTTGILVDDVSGLDTTKPGIACLSYTDPLDTSKAEWITYTSINSSTGEFNGVARGAEGSTGRTHSKGVTIAFPISKSHINNLNDVMKSGWVYSGETWTYASADDPTFTLTISGDKTGKYSAGMRVKLTQSSTTKYFIVTKVEYSSPNTTLTLYGGTDYDLANETISSPAFSVVKAPLGFPLDPDKWTKESVYTSQTVQSNPTANTWYNIGSFSIIIPIGCWNVSYNVYCSNASSVEDNLTASGALSTSSSSVSDEDLKASTYADSAKGIGASLTKSKTITLTAKDDYYFIISTDQSGTANLVLDGQYRGKAIIKAVSAYL